jgi:hypothetical protein
MNSNDSSLGGFWSWIRLVVFLWLMCVPTVFIMQKIWEFVAIRLGLSLGDGATTWSELGSLGDVFGVANSLFAGMAFAAIAYTLHRDHLHRKRDRKPLLLTKLDSELGVIFLRPITTVKPGELQLPLRLNFSVDNKSPEPAFNTRVMFSLANSTFSYEYSCQEFVIESEEGSVTRHVSLPDVAGVLRVLTEREAAELTIRSSYDNIEGAGWTTGARYRLSLRTGGRDIGLLNAVRDSATAWSETWGESDEVALEVQLIPGSVFFRESSSMGLTS